MENKTFKVKLPNGYLVCKEHGMINDFPGVAISFSKNGEFNWDNLIAIVEYEIVMGIIQTCAYNSNDDRGVAIRYNTGEIVAE